MLLRKLLNTSWCKFRKKYVHMNAKSTKIEEKDHDIKKIRNIGILAHIDAGKTTTTERMLYYSGLIRSMGEVHDGNTVTDYMEQERQRGITITSAAVTFDWKNHRFNLIDTPGHIDFTMEVEQTLRVLDGAVIILDGSAGVEAQTITVCRQADTYSVPTIAYINKMDRPTANFEQSLSSIKAKLNKEPLPVQLPMNVKGKFSGLVDLLSLTKLIFTNEDAGMRVQRCQLTEKDDGKSWEIANEQRKLLIDKLSGMDDTLANMVIEQESLENITAQQLRDSLRRIAMSRKGVPVFLGSSYKNIGVQPLMDGIVHYLPSPIENEYALKYKCFSNNMSARAFKVVHESRKGAITFVRIYTGLLQKGTKLYNVPKKTSEQSTRLYVPFADEYEEVAEVGAGNIAALIGLRQTRSGDLLTTSSTAMNDASKQMQKQQQMTNTEVNEFFTAGTKIPDAVFFCTVEPPSTAYQSALDKALYELQMEDPSLKVIQDTDNNQTVLGGMGELHIEIIKERIKSEYKVDVDVGPLQIAYKETIEKEVKDTLVIEQSIGKTHHYVNVTMSLIPNYKESAILHKDTSPESTAQLCKIDHKIMQAVEKGVTAAMSCGQRMGCPVVDVGVKLHALEFGNRTFETVITATVTRCIRKLMTKGNILLLEPIMHLEVVTPEEYSPAILGDLSRRRPTIQNISMQGQNKLIDAFVPLSEVLGYSTALRISSSGNATFSLRFSHYQRMSEEHESGAIKRITGVWR